MSTAKLASTQVSASLEVATISVDGPIAHLVFNRPEKRNAINDATLDALRCFFSAPPEGVKVAVISGAGGHFSAGLDLSEQVQREAPEVLRHSRNWHGVMDMIQSGGLPVVAVLTGAVMGGGLEIATAAHVRVAEPSARYQLPEGRRGIFVGGGATVRVGRILGADRMTEMMLTGRAYDAEEGHRLGLSHYLVGDGEGLFFARALPCEEAERAGDQGEDGEKGEGTSHGGDLSSPTRARFFKRARSARASSRRRSSGRTTP